MIVAIFYWTTYLLRKYSYYLFSKIGSNHCWDYCRRNWYPSIVEAISLRPHCFQRHRCDVGSEPPHLQVWQSSVLHPRFASSASDFSMSIRDLNSRRSCVVSARLSMSLQHTTTSVAGSKVNSNATERPIATHGRCVMSLAQ